MISGLVFVFVLLTLFAGFINGQGGMNSTILTSPMTATDATVTVQSTGGFLDADQITIGGEDMTYTSKDFTHFNGLTRGVNGTTVAAHTSGAMAYNQQTSILNQALGYNTTSVASTGGIIGIISIAIKFFTTTFVNLLSGRTLLTFLPAEIAWLGYLWLAIALGVVVSLAIALVWMLSGLVSKLPGF